VNSSIGLTVMRKTRISIVWRGMLILPFRSIKLCWRSEIGTNSTGFQEFPNGMKVNFRNLVSAFYICVAVGSFNVMTWVSESFWRREIQVLSQFSTIPLGSVLLAIYLIVLAFCYDVTSFSVCPPIDDKFPPHIVQVAQWRSTVTSRKSPRKRTDVWRSFQ